jgi:hypothetical protein
MVSLYGSKTIILLEKLQAKLPAEKPRREQVIPYHFKNMY